MGAVFSLFAGFYYWAPKIFGRMYSEVLAQIQFWSLFIGVNTTFFPQHFLGLAGIINKIFLFNLVDEFNLPLLFMGSIIVFYGPHINPKWRSKPVKVFNGADKENYIEYTKGKAIVYQWTNLITGRVYVGSGIDGASRLSQYWTPSQLNRNRPINNSLRKYGHANFSLGIIEVLGPSNIISAKALLEREQIYLNIIFIQDKSLVLNLAITAGSTLGFKHSKEFRDNRSGSKNPMHNREKSPEFLAQQTRDKSGVNNPQYGIIKSEATIAKLTKLVYVYKADTKEYVGAYKTVECKKVFQMGYDTLKKCIENGKPYKGLLFLRKQI